MKRLLAFLIVVVLAALAAFFFVRHQNPPRPPIATILPATTTFFVHLPDLERTRDDFRRTDLYALWREPAVQEFLAKPKANLPPAMHEANADLTRLRARDVFVAADDQSHLLGGLEFRCSSREAREILGRWETGWLPQARHSSEQRGSRHFEMVATDAFSIATIFSGDHFYFATDLGELEAMLNRAAKPGGGANLMDDKRYQQVMREWPRDYAAALYLQPEAFAKKLAAARPQKADSPAPAQTMLEKMSGAGYVLSLEGAKMREIGFAVMPKLLEANLTREALPVASSDAIFYLAALVDFSQFGASPGNTSPWPKFIPFSPDDFRGAFGEEFSMLMEWPAKARLPSLLMTVPVRDAARAQKIVAAWAEPAHWQLTTRDQTTFYRAPMLSLLAAVEPTLALSGRRLVFGTESGAVQRGLALAAAASPLSGTAPFRETTQSLPEPQQDFAYLDFPTLYRRLDALVRPILPMSAAFAPGLSNQIDPNKFPPADIVAKHLGPSAASQAYVRGGYRSESIGSLTLGQVVGTAIVSTVATRLMRPGSALSPIPNMTISPPPASSPSPQPTSSPP